MTDWDYFIIVACFFAIFGIKMLFELLIIRGCTDIVKGEITQCNVKVIRTGKRSSRAYEIWVLYSYNGQEYETESLLSGELPKDIGTIVDVCVDPGNPKRQYVKSFKKAKILVNIFAMVLGAAIFVVPLLFI